MNDTQSPRPPSWDDLDERLKRGRKAAGLEEEEDVVPVNRAAGEGFRVAIEFVVSVMVGTGLGFLIGKWAGSETIGLVLGMVVGFAAGMRTIYRFMKADAARNEEKDSGGDD